MIIIIVGFLLLEIEIFALASMKSGRRSYMQALNSKGEVIYEVKGSTMTNFNKYYFENTFGPLKNYQVRINTTDLPFPFRAWFSAAVGLPVGLVLLLAFILKAVMTFVTGRSFSETSGAEDSSEPSGRLAGILVNLSRFNIFIIGFLVFLAVFLFWMVPNLISFLARTGMETIIQFKWFFLGGAIAVFILFAWFLYMKYQLAKKSLDAQTEIRKYELQLEYVKNGGDLHELPGSGLNTKRLMAPIGDSSMISGDGHEDSNNPQGD